MILILSFCMWIFHTGTCAAVFVLRRSMPVELYPREFMVPLAIPGMMGIIGTYLVLVPFIQVRFNQTVKNYHFCRSSIKLEIRMQSLILDTFMYSFGLVLVLHYTLL